MRAEIIKIGNSKGLRIPKTLIEQCGFKNVVDLRIEDHSLVISPLKNLREGWEDSCKKMAQNNEDMLLDVGSIENSWDNEWEW